MENKQFEYAPIDNFTFIFDGNVTNDFNMSASKYLYMQGFSRIPSEWVYCIPFGLRSTQLQPTGSYTFTGKQGKNALVIHRSYTPESTVRVYGIYHNYLQVDNGLSKIKLL